MTVGHSWPRDTHLSFAGGGAGHRHDDTVHDVVNDDAVERAGGERLIGLQSGP
jgi:hypothetical protein